MYIIIVIYVVFTHYGQNYHLFWTYKNINMSTEKSAYFSSEKMQLSENNSVIIFVRFLGCVRC